MPDDDSVFARQATGWFGNFYMLFITFTNWVFGMVPINVRAMLVGGPRQPKEKDSTLKVGDAAPDATSCHVNIMVKGAKNLPKMDLSGKADPYVMVRMGAKEKKTVTVKKTLNPVWNESYMFEVSETSSAKIVFTVMDWDNVGRDSEIGTVKVPVQEVFSQQNIERDYELLHKNGETVLNDKGEAALLSLVLSFSQEETSGDAEWLNGVIRKAYRVIRPKVNAQVKEQLNATFAGLAIPVIKLELASFSIGQTSPWLMGLKLLPSRSDQDIQVESTLRWVADGEFHIKVLAKAGPVSVSVSVSDLEIQFPAWIQVRLQSTDPAQPAMSALQLAATDEPSVRFSISFGGVSTASIPGVENAIDYAIRYALKSALCLPNKVPAVAPEKLVLTLTEEERTAVGRLSVKFYEGDELMIPDSGVLGGIAQAMGTCDPYIVARLGKGKQEKRTKTISNTSTPKWNEVAEFLVHDEDNDTLTIEVLDEGPLDSSLIGTVKPEVKVSNLVKTQGWTEGWYDLHNKEMRGRVRMAVEYARLVPDDGPKVEMPAIEPGDAAVEDVTAKKPGEEEPTARAAAAPPPRPKVGKVVIRVVSAANLPSADGSPKSAFVILSSPITNGEMGADGKTVGLKGLMKRRTKTIPSNLNPTWDEEFTLLENTDSFNLAKTITLHVKDACDGKEEWIGKCTLTLQNILDAGKDGTEVELDITGKEACELTGVDGQKSTLKLFYSFADAAATDAEKEEPKVGRMLIRVVSAAHLPQMDITGKSDPYVVLSSPITTGKMVDGKVQNNGLMKRRTKTIEANLNPTWEEEFRFQESMDPVNMAKTITLHVKDADQFGTDEWIGKCTLTLQNIFGGGEDGAEFELDITGKSDDAKGEKAGKPVMGKDGKHKSTLKLFCSFSDSAMDAATDVGAEWLNGALRKGMRLFGNTIDQQVKDSMTATFANLGAIPGVKKIELEDFCIGKESPWIMAIKLLPTRSDQNIQLMCRLRWVCDAKMVLKIKVTTSAGVSLTVTAKNLELEFPAWIKAGIQSGLEDGAAEAWEEAKKKMRAAWEEAQAEAQKSGKKATDWVEPGAEPPVLTGYKVAAVEEPVLKFKLALGGMSFGAIPGLEDTLDSNIRSAMSNALVLPNSIAATTVDVTPKLSDLESKAVGRLSIKVYEAEGLVDPDAWGTCDPFVGLTLLSSKSEERQPKKTKTVYNTTSPSWNTFLEVLVLDPSTDKLKFEVLDEDLYKTDTLGTLTLQVRDLVAVTGWMERWHELNDGSGARVRLGLCYEKIVPDEGPPAPPVKATKKVQQAVVEEHGIPDDSGPSGLVVVTVAQAAKLPKMDFFGGADPYVEVRHGVEEAKTQVIKKELNPTWNETFELKYKGNKADLILTVKDWEKVGKNETMGFVRIPWADVEAGDGNANVYTMITKDGDRVKNSKGEESLLYVGVKLQLGV